MRLVVLAQKVPVAPGQGESPSTAKSDEASPIPCGSVEVVSVLIRCGC